MRKKVALEKSPKEEKFSKLWEKALSEYSEYDYGGAIEILNQAINVKPTDSESHFLLACCHSINEDIGKALTHLESSVANGLTDTEKILTHHDLAYLRMQPQFESFVKNGYRQLKELPEPVDDLLQSREADSPDLLEQLRQLNELKEKGQLTEIEYIAMKRKLNR